MRGCEVGLVDPWERRLWREYLTPLWGTDVRGAEGGRGGVGPGS